MDKSDINCYNSRNIGHYSNDFPYKENVSAKTIVAVVIEVEDGEAGGDFIFVITRKGNCTKYNEYELDNSGFLAFLQRGGNKKS